MGSASDLPTADAANKFEDLSGVEIKPGDNPYDALINACDGLPVSLFSYTVGFESIESEMERNSAADYGRKGRFFGEPNFGAETEQEKRTIRVGQYSRRQSRRRQGLEPGPELGSRISANVALRECWVRSCKDYCH